MNSLEKITIPTRPLSVREQVEEACRRFHEDPALRARQAEALRRTYGAMDDAEGEAFEQAVKSQEPIVRDA